MATAALIIVLAAVCAARHPNRAAAPPPAAIYVSPVCPPNGLPPGTIGHPFTSLADALRAAAEAAARPDKPEVAVLLDAAPGRNTHRVGAAVAVGAQHSGLAVGAYRSDGRPLANGDRAVVSGGVALSGHWRPPTSLPEQQQQQPQQHQHQQQRAWALDLTEAVSSGAVPDGFNQVWVSGARATRAREPEVGSYFRMQAAAPQGFQWAGNDLSALAAMPAGSAELSAVELVVYQSWQTSRRNVASVDASQRTVAMTAPCAVEIEPHANSGSRFYAENYAAAADNPGEWYYDRAAKSLLYVPEGDGPPPAASSFVVPAVSGALLVVNGTRGLVVSNVTFSHADWTIAGANVSSGTVQAASSLASAAVRVTNATGVVLVDCDVVHTGEHGVWIEGGSTGTVLDGVMVADVGAGGLRIGRGHPLADEPDGARTANTTVVDCTVVDGSHVFHEGNGILLQHSSGNTLLRTEVAYFNHVGISVGWTWDYAPSMANHNTVQECHVHHLGNGDLSDLGGIYLLGISPGTVVRGNCVHDSNPYYVYGHGVYLDQATSDVLVEGNALYHTCAAGALEHFGRNNTWTDNAVGLTFGGLGALWEANFQAAQFGSSDLTFQRNMVLVQGPSPLFQSPFNGTWLADRNLFWNLSDSSPGGLSATFPQDPTGAACQTPVSPGCFANATLAQWRARSGQDTNSLVADPMLTGDPSAGHFGVAAGSPAVVELGMAPVTASPETTGPRAGKQRAWSPCDAAGAKPACGAPPPVANGLVVASPRWACGDVAVYHCDASHEMSPAASTWRKCQPDGTWNGPPARCVPAPGPSRWLAQGVHLFDGDSLASDTSFLIQQGDGNLCLYRGSIDHNEGGEWCSGVQHQGESYLVVQPDGNMCTRDIASNAPLWCSRSNQTGCRVPSPPSGCVFFVAVDGNRACVHRGKNPDDDRGAVWCAPKFLA